MGSRAGEKHRAGELGLMAANTINTGGICQKAPEEAQRPAQSKAVLAAVSRATVSKVLSRAAPQPYLGSAYNSQDRTILGVEQVTPGPSLPHTNVCLRETDMQQRH